MSLRRLAAALAITGMAALAFTACSGGSSGGSSTGGASDVTISGSLSAASSFTGSDVSSADYTRMAVDLANLKIYAIAFSNPPTIKEADLNSDGSFSLTLAGAKGSQISAVFKDKTDDSQVGMITFVDTSKKDLNGNDKESTSVTLNDSVSLGAIQLGTDGKVKVPVSQIASVTNTTPVAVGSTFDFTGQWTIAAFDGTIPTGYSTVIADPGGGNCGGPCIGEPITLIRLAGKEFTPNGSCLEGSCPSTAGSIGTNDAYGMSIWGGSFADGIGACGSKLGFSADDARFGGNIHLASAPTVGTFATSFGDYVFTTAAGYGGNASPYNLPWMKTGGTTSYSINDCRPWSVTNGTMSYGAYACLAEEVSGGYPGTPSGTVAWQINIQGGGCINTATNKPVNIQNWNVFPDSCTDSDSSATYGAGYRSNTCTYSNKDHDNSGTTANINYSCTHTSGAFMSSGTGGIAAQPTSTPYHHSPPYFLGQPKTLLAAGAQCNAAGSGNNQAKLLAYQCYANIYYQENASQGGCARDYRFNFAATTPEQFVDTGGRGKPKNAFITNIIDYSADGQSATVNDEENSTITVQTGSSSSTFCEIGRLTGITVTKINDSKLLFNLVQRGQMLSTDAACQAVAKEALAGNYNGPGDLQYELAENKFIFYMTK